MKFFSNYQRQFQKFKKRKTAYYSLFILIFFLLVSLFAECIANDKPFFLFYKGELFFPLTKAYSSSDFDYPDIQPDYKKICNQEAFHCVWPLIKFGPLEIDGEINQYPSVPSVNHPMGVDSLGRDIFARMIYGFRVSFSYALGVWLISFTLGTLIGSCMGYFGGWFDIVMYRFMEVFFAIPYLVVLITLVSVFNPNIYMLVLISSLFNWGSITRYMRSEFLKIRNLDYVQSAMALGCTHRQILFKHILPNALTPLITFSPFFIASSILSLSSLDFLGLGVQPPTPSWGELLRQGKEFFMTAWYLALFPCLGLFITLALINFIGEGIRDAFDPRKY